MIYRLRDNQVPRSQRLLMNSLAGYKVTLYYETMKQNTREVILNAAKELFRDNDYKTVSLKAIADKCGISVGNLNYHYQYKKDLILEFMDEVQVGLKQNMSANSKEPLSDLFDVFTKQYNNQKEFLFYFKSFVEFGIDYPEVRRSQEKFRETLYRYYFQTLRRLRKEGLMSPTLNDKELEALCLTILMTNTFWVQTNSPSTDALFADWDFVECMRYLLLPYLTEAGAAKLEQYFNAVED